MTQTKFATQSADTVIDKQQTEQTEQKQKRGRKIKYLTEEDKINARRQQQKEYRARKKSEIEKLKEEIEELKKKIELLENSFATKNSDGSE